MADYPNLIHPIPVKLRLANTGETLMDPITREPVGKVARDSEETVDGQISWKNQGEVMKVGGKEYTVEGYVLFRVRDLIAAGITVAEEDLIISMGEGEGYVETNFYIFRIQRRGHYPEFGGHTLIKAWYTRKTPVRHR